MVTWNFGFVGGTRGVGTIGGVLSNDIIFAIRIELKVAKGGPASNEFVGEHEV